MINPHDVQDLFSVAPGSTYLDSATYGLPPKATIEALDRALRGWQSGEATWLDWDREGEVCRRLFADMKSTGSSREATGSDHAEYSHRPTPIRRALAGPKLKTD